MKRYEKWVLALIALLLLSRVGGVVRDMYLSSVYGSAGPPPNVYAQWKLASQWLSHLVNIGAGLWLFLAARKEKLAQWVWGLFGLFFGLLGVVVYFVLLPELRREET